MLKITESRLRRIILEEIAAMDAPAGEDEAAMTAEDAEAEALELLPTISKKASTLFKAIKAFKSECPEGCMSHVEGELKKLEKTLVNMAKNPGNYAESKSASLPGEESSELFAPEEEPMDDEEEEELEGGEEDSADDEGDGY